MPKTIHPRVSGTLLAILDDMGHGDEIVIADAVISSGERRLYANILLRKGVLRN